MSDRDQLARALFIRWRMATTIVNDRAALAGAWAAMPALGRRPFEQMADEALTFLVGDNAGWADREEAADIAEIRL